MDIRFSPPAYLAHDKGPEPITSVLPPGDLDPGLSLPYVAGVPLARLDLLPLPCTLTTFTNASPHNPYTLPTYFHGPKETETPYPQ